MKEKVYGVFRVQKIKCSNGGGLAKRLKHSTREFVADNIDKTRLKLDEKIGAQTYYEAVEKIRKLWDKADTKRSDSVGVLETLITTTGKLPKGQEADFIFKSVEQLKKMYGENLVGYYVHRDEKETHIHAFSVPLETKEVEKKHLSADELQKLKDKLSENKIAFQEVPKKPGKEADSREWEKYKKQKKDYEKFKKQIKPFMQELGFTKTETTLSCQSICGSAYVLSQQQDLWHKEVFSHFGLERGNKKEKQTPEKYKNPTKVKKWAEKLEAKEQELEEREKNIASEMLEKYKQTKKNFLKGSNIESFELPAPEKNEKAKDYILRIQPDIDSLFDSSKIFEQEYWKLYRRHPKEIEAARQEERDKAQKTATQLENNINTQKQEKIALQRKYDALESKFNDTSRKLINWRENSSPDDLRQIAEKIENAHCQNFKQFADKKQRQQENEQEIGWS